MVCSKSIKHNTGSSYREYVDLILLAWQCDSNTEYKVLTVYVIHTHWCSYGCLCFAASSAFFILTLKPLLVIL